MNVRKNFYKLVYLLVYVLSVFALTNILYSIKDNIDSLQSIIINTISPVITITISTVTIVLILFRLSHISKYNIPQVVIMKIKYYKLMVITAATFIIIVFAALISLLVVANYVNDNIAWIYFLTLEIALVTFVFLLFYLLIVSISLMYKLKAGGDGYDILFTQTLSKADFLTIISSVEGDISRHHAKELVYNILNADHNNKLREQVLATIDHNVIAKIYNFEIKYQLLKYWWSEDTLETTILRLRSRELNYKRVKAVLEDYERLIIEFICEDIKKTTYYKYKKSYLFEKLITEIFLLTESNLESYENFRTYVFVCEYMDNLIYQVIERSRNNTSELMKYYVDYLTTVKDSFTEDIWFDIISEKILTVENNSNKDNTILLKCILNSSKKFSDLYFTKSDIGYYIHLLNMNNRVDIKCNGHMRLYFTNNTIINNNAVSKVVNKEKMYLSDCTLIDFCTGLLILKGYYKYNNNVSEMLSIETSHTTRMFDLLLEANDRLTKDLENSERDFVVMDKLYSTDIGERYLNKIGEEFNKHVVCVNNIDVDESYSEIEKYIKKTNSRYYRSIKLLTAYARINIDDNNPKKSLPFLEEMSAEEVSSTFKSLFKIVSQVSIDAKFNLLNPLMFIYLNLLYHTKYELEINLKYEIVSGVGEVLELFRKMIKKEKLESELSDKCKTLLKMMLASDDRFAPYINYKHIISSIENEEFKKRNYVIYGIEFSELFGSNDYKSICQYLEKQSIDKL